MSDPALPRMKTRGRLFSIFEFALSTKPIICAVEAIKASPGESPLADSSAGEHPMAGPMKARANEKNAAMTPRRVERSSIKSIPLCQPPQGAPEPPAANLRQAAPHLSHLRQALSW
jgi:hypothetical protein